MTYARPETRRRDGIEAPSRDEGRPAWTRSEAFAEDVADAPQPLHSSPSSVAAATQHAGRWRHWLALLAPGLPPKPMAPAR
ncbi:MAG: hypothetical protein KGI90_13510 [Burkholderiales bacterium]|nr:hypothetical protein [Burkholderiales bacterium]